MSDCRDHVWELGMGYLGCGTGLWGLQGIWTIGHGEGNDRRCTSRTDAFGGAGCCIWEPETKESCVRHI